MEEQMEPKKEEVGVGLDDALQERVGAYASREGFTLGEAISALLYLGLEFAERQRTGLKEDIEDLPRELRDLRQMVDVIGPAALAPDGNFTRMALRMEPQLSDRLASLEPRAVEARLEEATRNALLRESPRAQGVYLARFEASARGSLEPVVHVHLSCRHSDGGPAPALTREGERRVEAAWTRAVERVFGLARGRANEPEHRHTKDRAT